MSEYITRERALEILNDIGGCGAEPGSYTAGWDEAINAAYEAIQDEPAADVAPVVHGEWLNIDGDYTFAACSICETAYEVATEEEIQYGACDYNVYQVVCNGQNCNAMNGWSDTPEEAADKWNRRVDNG